MGAIFLDYINHVSALQVPQKVNHLKSLFLGKISATLSICIMKKSKLVVPCKGNRFGY